MPSTIDWLWNRRQAVWGQVEALETPGSCIITDAMSRKIDRADRFDILIIDCPAETLAEVLTKARLLEEFTQAEGWVDDRPHRMAESICRDLERLTAN